MNRFAGIVVPELAGIFGWTLPLRAAVVGTAIALVALRVVFGLRRARDRVRSINARLTPLSDERLIEIMRTPTHSDSQFALVELMRRGSDARPTKDQLFGMLTSGNMAICGDAMANLQIFYPEISLPEGSSNLDPPELWQSRVEAFRRTG